MTSGEITVHTSLWELRVWHMVAVFGAINVSMRMMVVMLMMSKIEMTIIVLVMVMMVGMLVMLVMAVATVTGCELECRWQQ